MWIEVKIPQAVGSSRDEVSAKSFSEKSCIKLKIFEPDTFSQSNSSNFTQWDEYSKRRIYEENW